MTAQNDMIAAAAVAANASLGIDAETEAALEADGADAMIDSTEIATLAQKLDLLDGLTDGMVGDLPLAEVVGDILDTEGLTGDAIHQYVVGKFGEEKVAAAFQAAQESAYGEDYRDEANLSEFGEDDLSDDEFEALLNEMFSGLFDSSNR
jgi:hypothetical protein